ncbi:MAG: hypothetical protein A2V83_08005 [Nitrospirae bacterium RBG_16_64_22]|nr:MAG: hypothetical protein A2V83_08005 [Nitrospirae bacterium RBG_16_64_22]
MVRPSHSEPEHFPASSHPGISGEAGDTQADQASSSILNRGQARILVVNGDRSFCFVCKEILREAGYRPALSFEAGEAWERLGREHFDLVLWDLDLPGMPGVDLIEWEPRSPLSGGRLPAIFLSVHGPGEARTRPGGLPAACLSKPIDFPDLLEKIHEALGSPGGLFGEKRA